jgi:polyketide cyclase/dehydrase/lipid transport protein
MFSRTKSYPGIAIAAGWVRNVALLVLMPGLLAQCTTTTRMDTSERIEWRAAIEIDRDIETVFAFASNTDNDRLWRSEVRAMRRYGPLQAGSVVAETVAVGVNPGHTTTTMIVKFQRPHLISVETLPDDPNFLKVQRVFKSRIEGRTQMTYALVAGPNTVTEIALVPMTAGFAVWYYEAQMRSDLRRLKKILEDG